MSDNRPTCRACAAKLGSCPTCRFGFKKGERISCILRDGTKVHEHQRCTVYRDRGDFSVVHITGAPIVEGGAAA